MRERRQSGFTLIEVVVAFALLALVLAASFEIFTTGLSRAADLDDYSGAIDVAQSQIAAVGTYGKIQEGESHGESEDGRYAWIVAVRTFDESADPNVPAQSTVVMYRVDVQVNWRGLDTRTHALGLATVIVGPRLG
jgi:general secretion pathway protein I